MAGQSQDFDALGFPSAEYIGFNLQSLAHYAETNGGTFRVPFSRPIKKLPTASLVIHHYKGYFEVRLIKEDEYRLEKLLEKGIEGKPVGEGKGESK